MKYHAVTPPPATTAITRITSRAILVPFDIPRFLGSGASPPLLPAPLLSLRVPTAWPSGLPLLTATGSVIGPSDIDRLPPRSEYPLVHRAAGSSTCCPSRRPESTCVRSAPTLPASNGTDFW